MLSTISTFLSIGNWFGVTIPKIKQRLYTIPFDRIENIAAADSFILFSFSFS